MNNLLLFIFCVLLLNNTHAILSGGDVEPNNVPYIVNFRQSKIPNLAQCSGVIISNNAILTVNTCAKVNDFAIAGDHSLTITENTEQNRTVIKKIPHPKATPYVDRPYNFAILIVDNDFIFNKYVQPINLPNMSDCLKEYEIVAYGWGRLTAFPTAEFPDTLKQANLPIIDRKTCQANSTMQFVSNSICVGKNNLIQAMDVYDSGGPLVQFNHIGIPYLVGITYFPDSGIDPLGSGKGLSVGGNIPGIRDWIDETLRNN